MIPVASVVFPTPLDVPAITSVGLGEDIISANSLQIRSDRFVPPQPPRASACGMGIVHTPLTQGVSLCSPTYMRKLLEAVRLVGHVIINQTDRRWW